MFRLLISVLFMFFLPGYTLINAIYPGRGELDEELDMLYRITYSIGMSVVVVLIVGFVLGHTPGTGFVAINMWISLVSLTGLFFFVGWYRGGYQSLSFISPKLTKPGPAVTKYSDEDSIKVKRLQKVVRKRAILKEKIKRSKDERERKKAKRELEMTEKKLKELEKKREEDF